MPTLATSPRFFFRQRHGSIDWRKIANLDVDRIACEVDVDSLQELADNIAFAAVDERTFVSTIPLASDFLQVKLIRIAQMIMEYLMSLLGSFGERLQVTEDELEDSHRWSHSPCFACTWLRLTHSWSRFLQRPAATRRRERAFGQERETAEGISSQQCCVGRGGAGSHSVCVQHELRQHRNALKACEQMVAIHG